MTAKHGPRKTVSAAETRPAKAPPEAIVVSKEEERHLIEDVAYFHAEHYRHIEPGQCREQDRRDAEAQIKAVIKRRRGP
jgi:hypothetical protein